MSTASLLTSNGKLQRYALALLRIVTGIVFAVHGYQKLFVFGIAGVQGAFTKMGAPMPMVMGPIIACIELFGGIALILGLLTRLAALGLAFDMLGAILIVHLAKGFSGPMGYEFPLVLCTAMLTLVLAGPGGLSIDGMIARRHAEV
jgi:putative oxidoreductase